MKVKASNSYMMTLGRWEFTAISVNKDAAYGCPPAQIALQVRSSGHEYLSDTADAPHSSYQRRVPGWARSVLTVRDFAVAAGWADFRPDRAALAGAIPGTPLAISAKVC